MIAFDLSEAAFQPILTPQLLDLGTSSDLVAFESLSGRKGLCFLLEGCDLIECSPLIIRWLVPAVLNQIFDIKCQYSLARWVQVRFCCFLTVDLTASRCYMLNIYQRKSSRKTGGATCPLLLTPCEMICMCNYRMTGGQVNSMPPFESY